MKHKINISLIYFALAMIAFFVANNPVTHSINDTNAFIISAGDFSPSFHKHMVENEDVGIQTYSYTLHKESLEHLNTDLYSILINKATYQAIAIELNDQIIFSEGDMKNGQSRLKNSFSYCVFDHNILKEVNEIIIKTYASYKSGIEDSSIYIISSVFGNQLVRKLNFYNNNIIFLGLGMLLFSAIFIVLIYIISDKKDISFIYCSIAIIFLGFYFLDYVKVTSMAFSYLTTKKLIMLFLYVGSLFYTFALSRFLHNNVLNWTMAVTTMAFVVIMFISKDMIMFKRLYDYMYIVYVLNIVLAFILCIINFVKRKYTYIFLLGFLFIFIYAGSAIIFELIGDSFAINSPFVYIIVLAAFPFLLGIDSLLSYENEIIEVHKLRKIDLSKAETDSLTDLYNRRFIIDRLPDIILNNESIYPLSILMLDIDYFKKVNDDFGHIVGDEVLIALAALLKEDIRNNDYACRYGGEEFLVVFTQTNTDKAKMISSRILNKFKHKTKEIVGHPISFSGGLVTVDSSSALLNLNTLIDDADMLLYKAKKSGRDCIMN